jgi:hypothetical protein
MATLAVVAALLLAAAHFLAPKLRFLSGPPRSRWLSAAGGVSVAYVFVHLMPELAEGQRVVERAMRPELAFVGRHTYLIALAGLAVFYGIERFSVRRRSRTDEHHKGDDTETDATGFVASIASFAVYNAIVGYLLLHRLDRPVRGLVLYAIAMALHFVVNDYGLREHHKQRYDRFGRSILVVALLMGALVGVVWQLPEAVIAAVIAFLAGGIVLNVLKEELPEKRQSRYWAFLVGAFAYAALLLVLSATGDSAPQR